MKRPVLTLVALALVALPLAGCTVTEDVRVESSPIEAPGFPVTVGDVTLAAPPTAIVSLSPTATEMLFAIGAGEQVVAVDEFSTYPPEAPVTDLSGFTPNVEAILSYEPDLVVISYDPGDLVAQLTTLGVPVHTVPDNPRTLDDIYRQITDLGKLTGRSAEAEALVDQMVRDIEEIVSEAPTFDPPLTYYIEIDNTLWTYTSQSIVGNLFTVVGLENVAVTDDPAMVTMQLNPEFLIAADPDVIFLTDSDFGESAQTVSARPGWGEITAVREGAIVELDPDVASRWGPRVVDLLRQVVDALGERS